jgi:hypothetical protein
MRNLLLAILLGVSVAVPWHVWRQARLRARTKSEELQRGASALAVLDAENESLSNRAELAAKDSPSTEQFRELLKLRGEIGALRQASNDMEKLKARNARLEGQLTNSAPLLPPDPQKILAHWSKEQLSMAGYADPISAVSTVLWAISHNDPNAYFDSVTADARKLLTREQWNNHGPAAEELAGATQRFADSLESDTGFDVVGQSSQAGGKTTVEVYFEGEGRTRKFLMQQVSGDWKFDGLEGWGNYLP